MPITSLRLLTLRELNATAVYCFITMSTLDSFKQLTVVIFLRSCHQCATVSEISLYVFLISISELIAI